MNTLLDYLKAVAQSASWKLDDKTGIENETVKDNLIRLFNFYHKDYNSRYNWPWNKKDLVIQTVANYKTGTVSVTNGSRTVTGAGTAWTSAMAGRFLKLDRDQDIYEILSASGTSLTLKTPYIGTSASAQKYIVWKKFYSLFPDVSFPKGLFLSKWPYSSDKIGGGTMRDQFINPWNEGFPEAWTWEKIDRTTSTYNTGTVTIAKGSKTLTGSGTSWLDNVYPGTEIVVGTSVFNAETVDSDTQITTVQIAKDAIGGQPYTATTTNRSQISFSRTPDPAVNIMGHYFKKTYDYKNDDDKIEIWEGFEHILISVLHGHLKEKLTDDKAFAWLNIYENQLLKAWQSLQGGSASDVVPTVRGRRIISGYRPTLYGYR